MHRDEGNFYRVVSRAVKEGASIGIQAKTYRLEPELYSDNVVADRALSMLTSLTKLPEDQMGGFLALAAAALTAFVLAEILYIRIVKRAACREIRLLFEGSGSGRME